MPKKAYIETRTLAGKVNPKCYKCKEPMTLFPHANKFKHTHEQMEEGNKCRKTITKLGAKCTKYFKEADAWNAKKEQTAFSRQIKNMRKLHSYMDFQERKKN